MGIWMWIEFPAQLLKAGTALRDSNECVLCSTSGCWIWLPFSKENTWAAEHVRQSSLLNALSTPHPPHPRVLSTFRPANVCGAARPEEPHSPARRKLCGQGQGWRHQLHYCGLERVYVQHLAPGAHPQVSSCLLHRTFGVCAPIQCTRFNISQIESRCSFVGKGWLKTSWRENRKEKIYIQGPNKQILVFKAAIPHCIKLG